VADVSLRLRELTDPFDVIVELRDPENGLFVEAFMPPPDNVREARRKPARGHGGNRVGVKLDDEGTAQVVLRIEGTDWPDVQTKWAAIRAGLRAFDDFYLEEVVDGVTTRWLAERGNVTPAEHVGEIIASAFIVQDLRFTCQPFPSVDIA
jgi:hypothetical protein